MRIKVLNFLPPYIILLCLGIFMLVKIKISDHQPCDCTQYASLQQNSSSHMLIIATKSRLGNNMFQYASGLGIAKRNGLKPVVFPQQKHNIVLFKAFLIDTYHASELNETNVFHFNQVGYSTSYDERTETLASLSRTLDKHIMLNGHWRSLKYFSNIPDEMLYKIFTFKGPVIGRAQLFLKRNIPENLKTKKKDIVYVGVHIRLGDRGEDWGEEKEISKEKYLKDAADYYTGLHDNVLFAVCSDDISRSKQIFPHGHNVIYSHNNKPETDMAILASCNHSIMTVGSFGWWAAKLAGGQVTYYANHNFYEYHSKKYITEHIYPKHWIPL